MRDKWEYKMLVGSGVPPHWKDADDATDYGRSLETEILNRLGQDGWEDARSTCRSPAGP